MSLLLLLPQALSSLPAGLCELLRSLHVHSLKNDEVLLFKDSRRLAEHKDAGPQVGVKTFHIEGMCLVSISSKAEVGSKRREVKGVNKRK